MGLYPTSLEWQGERLTEDQLYEVARLSGPKLRTDLEKLTATSAYSKWSDDLKTKVVGKYIQARHKQAKVKVVRSP